MIATSSIDGRVLDKVHYITFPAKLSLSDLDLIENKIADLSQLPVDLHVLDLKLVKSVDQRFLNAVKALKEKSGGKQIVSINVSDELFALIERAKMENVINRIRVFPDDMYEKKEIKPEDKKRLLIRHLIRSSYEAVEQAAGSTVSCDENYLAKIDKVPFTEFDLISAVDLRNDFIEAQVRLCSSTEVLNKLASAMVGPKAVDQELILSMATELLNFIYGGAKSALNNHEGFRLPSAIPHMLSKMQFLEIKRVPHNISILPLVTPLGTIYIELDIRRS